MNGGLEDRTARARLMRTNMISRQRLKNFLGAVIFIVGMWGCATSPSPSHDTMQSISEQSLAHVQMTDLAGVWEYKEGSVVYPLTFDQKGNGVYEWKHGRFVTTSLENGIWKGSWHQRDNDREGEFEMQLAGDLQTATGRWWYTRIGKDHAPLDPGGTFTLMKLSSQTSQP